MSRHLRLVTLTESARRLFFGYAEADLLAPQGRGLLFSRFLEDAEGEELAALFASVPEGEIAAWLTRWGGRKLSCRSLAFWQLILRQAGVAGAVGGEHTASADRTDRADRLDANPRSDQAEALWPL